MSVEEGIVFERELESVSSSVVGPKMFETMEDDDVPQVGGKLGGVVWVGGTNLVANQKKKPVDIL